MSATETTTLTAEARALWAASEASDLLEDTWLDLFYADRQETCDIAPGARHAWSQWQMGEQAGARRSPALADARARAVAQAEPPSEAELLAALRRMDPDAYNDPSIRAAYWLTRARAEREANPPTHSRY